MFDALAAAPSGAVHGFGVPLESLTFGLLVFPIVWDWYIQWRERRRGFYTAWEVDMLRIAIALTRADTGWVRQSPQLAERIRPIPNLITERDIATIRDNWAGACKRMHKHGLARAKEGFSSSMPAEAGLDLIHMIADAGQCLVGIRQRQEIVQEDRVTERWGADVRLPISRSAHSLGGRGAGDRRFRDQPVSGSPGR